ncbi:MAG: maltotransferase domain-containing protein, partial [Actinomycetota bacterium]
MISRFGIVDISPTTFFGGEFIGAKAVVDEAVAISATIIREGHEGFDAYAVLVDENGKISSREKMVEIWPNSQRFEAHLRPKALGNWSFYIEVSSQNPGEFAKNLMTKSESYPIRVERERALIGNWYECFPRSEGAKKNSDGSISSGNFRSAADRIEDVAKMGFDVLYLPPIHPIGYSHRKGRNNSLTAGPLDPGVPWAIGNESGGHDAINPELGTFDDFKYFLKVAKKNNIEVALDLALQCSPDHPWVKTNPEWFTKRADGSIAYAENPPKKYQDIYPLNFDNDYPGLFAEIYRVVTLWIELGINIFRVDNPHTKPINFWADLIAKINEKYPQVILLAEAFTTPAM